ncbi:MAG TPA: nuclear transport factor 2 family protein [Streptosporangiaceae bacterium]|jgi:predicted ester cyclase
MSATPGQTVRAFLDAYARRDVDAALAVVDPAARVAIAPLGPPPAGIDGLRRLMTDTVAAFPDLLLTVRDLIEAGAVVLAEFKLEGTQAAAYLGAVNQEKHLDVDQAWRFGVAGDRITEVDAYWCQNQLYRRLAVKRLDQIAIV